MIHRTLFSGKDLELDVLDRGHDISIVTFEARDKFLTPRKVHPFGQGYGPGLFAPMGMNEFIIKRNKNIWYQTPEMLSVARIINAMTRGHRVITYGGSMGGFAAINFAPLLNADEFVALSPLFDVAPDGVLQDRRWEIDWPDTSFNYNLIRTGACRSARGYVFFANNSPDGPHAELLAKETSATVIELDYGGHPCSFFLNDAYKLKTLVAEIAFGSFDAAKFRQVLEERTPLTHYPYERRSAQLEKDGADEAALEQIELAVSRKPNLARLHSKRGNLLLKKKEFGDAAAAFHSAIGLEPNSSYHHVRLSYAHAGTGNYAQAVHMMDTAIALAPRRAEYHARRAEWLLAAERYREAAVDFQEAIRLDAKSSNHHVRLSYAYAGMKSFAEAAEAMDNAISLLPDKAEYHVRRGEWLLADQKLEAAALAMRKAIEILPTAVVAPRRLKFIESKLEQGA